MKKLKIKSLYYTNSKNIHILDENHSYNRQSLASYVQLKEWYRRIENPNKLPLKKRIYLNFRNRTLKIKKKENKGNLVCFYCGKEHLDPNFNNPSKNNRGKATVDHYKSRGKGGKTHDIKNIRVSCSKCNSLKGDLSPEDFYNKFKNNKKFKEGLFFKNYNSLIAS